MTATTTPEGMPRVPLLERWYEAEAEERMFEYGRLCYEAGAAQAREQAAQEPMSARRSASLDELEAVVLAYCKECAAQARAQALKDAAQECDALASIEGIAQRCAEAIRALAQKGDA